MTPYRQHKARAQRKRDLMDLCAIVMVALVFLASFVVLAISTGEL